MLDILIQNAQVIDGTGSTRKKFDVGIRDNKLVLDTKGLTATETIDAEGLILTPGFIDVHGHSELFAFIDPLCSAKLCQGITTEICGQCGISAAPVSPKYLPVFKSYCEHQGMPMYPNVQNLTSVGALMDTVDALKPGINMAFFAAHGALRIAAMGMDPGRPDAQQLDTMTALAKEAMDDGALGISSGLMYAPGSFAEYDELVAVCAATASKGGIYTSHLRNQGNLLLQSVEETLKVGREANVSVNISHHKAVGKGNWGSVTNSTALIHRYAYATHDIYPYTASSTVLSATLPPSCMKKGMEYLLDNLRDLKFQQELKQSIFQPSEQWDNDLMECGYDGILIIQATKTPEAVGKTIGQCAEVWGIEPFEAYCKLLWANDLAVSDVCFSMSEEDVAQLLRDPLCMFGTDSLYVPQLMTMTHPRAIGTFPRILGHYVREKQLLSLEEAIRKMTYFPAVRYGLTGKGIIAEGADADLVLFDANTIEACSDYTNPLQPNKGINRVYVGGQLAVMDSKTTGARAGRVLRRNSR